MTSDDPPRLSGISEFRRRALALAAVKDERERTPFLELVVELARELDAIRGDLRQVKINQGTLGSKASAQAAATTMTLIEPLEARLEAFARELRDVASDVAKLRERAVGEGGEDE